jgi:hypothetical protein
MYSNTENSHVNAIAEAFNRFIDLHNNTLNEDVIYIRMKDYCVVHDRRTHPITIFTSGAGGAMQADTPQEAVRKLYRLIRDKYNEADRPLLPCIFRTRNLHTEYISFDFSNLSNIEERRGYISIINNTPIYSKYPLFNIKDDPLLTLLIRIPILFKFFASLDIYKSILAGNTSKDVNNIDHIALIEDRIGQGLLEQSIGFRTSKTTSINEIIPKVSSPIDFQSFEVVNDELTTIFNENIINRDISYYTIRAPYLLLKVSEIEDKAKETKLPLNLFGYNLLSWIDKDDYFYEFDIDNNKKLNLTTIFLEARRQRVVSLNTFPKTITNCKYALYSSLFNPNSSKDNSKNSKDDVEDNSENNSDTIIEYVMNGEYRPPEKISTSSFLFKHPIKCKQVSLEEITIFPTYVQRKLDGNRIIIHCLDYGASITYYSKVGALQTSKFPTRFNQDIIRFCQFITNKYNRNNSKNNLDDDNDFKDESDRSFRNIMIDCECYAPDVIHEKIAGYCNRVESSSEFEQLYLYVLSFLDLDKIEMYIERKKEYYCVRQSFEEFFSGFGNDFGDNIDSLVKINETKLINNQEELFNFMKQSIDEGNEGLVVYPCEEKYTFGMDRLMKIKKIYDGECIVLGYEKSKTEPGAIGAVIVSSPAYFGIQSLLDTKGIEKGKEETLTYSISASLTNEWKSGSMDNILFTTCIGKPYTIICDSFSDNGTPMHARFKTSFTPYSYRKDV